MIILSIILPIGPTSPQDEHMAATFVLVVWWSSVGFFSLKHKNRQKELTMDLESLEKLFIVTPSLMYHARKYLILKKYSPREQKWLPEGGCSLSSPRAEETRADNLMPVCYVRRMPRE